MTPYEIEKTISDFLKYAWTATAIRSVNKDPAPSLPFIEFHCKPGQTVPIEIQGYGERSGVFMINVFTGLGNGVAEGGAYSGLLEELFWHRKISDVICENGSMLPYTSDLGADAERQCWHHQVVIPFFNLMEY